MTKTLANELVELSRMYRHQQVVLKHIPAIKSILVEAAKLGRLRYDNLQICLANALLGVEDWTRLAEFLRSEGLVVEMNQRHLALQVNVSWGESEINKPKPKIDLTSSPMEDAWLRMKNDKANQCKLLDPASSPSEPVKRNAFNLTGAEIDTTGTDYNLVLMTPKGQDKLRDLLNESVNSPYRQYANIIIDIAHLIYEERKTKSVECMILRGGTMFEIALAKQMALEVVYMEDLFPKTEPVKEDSDSAVYINLTNTTLPRGGYGLTYLPASIERSHKLSSCFAELVDPKRRRWNFQISNEIVNILKEELTINPFTHVLLGEPSEFNRLLLQEIEDQTNLKVAFIEDIEKNA